MNPSLARCLTCGLTFVLLMVAGGCATRSVIGQQSGQGGSPSTGGMSGSGAGGLIYPGTGGLTGAGGISTPTGAGGISARPAPGGSLPRPARAGTWRWTEAAAVPSARAMRAHPAAACHSAPRSITSPTQVQCSSRLEI